MEHPTCTPATEVSRIEHEATTVQPGTRHVRSRPIKPAFAIGFSLLSSVPVVVGATANSGAAETLPAIQPATVAPQTPGELKNAPAGSETNRERQNASAAGTRTNAVRFEAERPLRIVRDMGVNSEIGTANGQFDSGESVKLYDDRDAIRVDLVVPKTGMFKIAARVRAGGPESETSFWPDGYSFTLDGQAVVLTGDKSTLSELDSSYGGCHWGTMLTEPMPLKEGLHQFEIKSEANWAVADYVELTEVPPGPLRVELEKVVTVVNDVGASAINVADGQLDSVESVMLYDVGDSVTADINLPAATRCTLAVRLRSGGETGPTVFWPGGYEFKLNGESLALEGDARSISARDETYGGCFWGTMKSRPVNLRAGPNTVQITAAAPWGVVDYIEIIPEERIGTGN